MLGIERGEAAEMAARRFDVDHQARRVAEPGISLHEVMRGLFGLDVGEAYVVDAGDHVARQLRHQEVPGGPHGDAGSTGDRLEHGVDVTGGRQVLGHRLQGLEALGQHVGLLPQDDDLTLEARLDRRRGIPVHLDEAAGVAPGLALELLDLGGFHAEQHRKLRQRPQRVSTEQGVSGVIRGHDADQAVRLVDVDDFGARDGRLLGRDGGVGTKHLGGRSDRSQQGQHLGARVLAEDLDAGFAPDVGIVEHVGRGCEKSEALFV